MSGPRRNSLARAGVLGCVLAGCAGAPPPPALPEVEWATYRANPEAYAGQPTLIRVDLATVAADPQAFADKTLILQGRVRKVGWRAGQASGSGDWYRWNFVLEAPSGAAVRCYEETYGTEAWEEVVFLMQRAEAQRGGLVVAGRYGADHGLELDWLTYGNETLDTDNLPPRGRYLLQ